MKEVNYALKTWDNQLQAPAARDKITHSKDRRSSRLDGVQTNHSQKLRRRKKPSNQIFKINRKGGRILASDVSKPMVKGM